MSGHDGGAPSREAVAAPDIGGAEQSVVADYTEKVVPASAAVELPDAPPPWPL
jgi:hypothetical protein